MTVFLKLFCNTTATDFGTIESKQKEEANGNTLEKKSENGRCAEKNFGFHVLNLRPTALSTQIQILQSKISARTLISKC